MKVWLLLLLLMACACRAETVTIATGEWPPYSGAALPHNGTVMDELSRAFAAAGVEVRFEFMSWNRALELTRAGKYLATPMWLQTADRARDFVLAGPIVRTTVVLFHRKDHPVEWQTLGDLAAIKTGVSLGYSYGPAFDKLVADHVLAPDIAPNDELGLIRVAGGHIDVFLLDRDVGLYLIDHADRPAVKSQLTFDPKPVHSDPTYLLFSRKYPNSDVLAQRFGAAWIKLQAAGEIPN
ncbi:MAG: transporter substrate-binding domain-containing protein [Burkholderiales bacterium]|nr:transporter substrate-binding domain-containing protein [Burkholderiales bacterium]